MARQATLWRQSSDSQLKLLSKREGKSKHIKGRIPSSPFLSLCSSKYPSKTFLQNFKQILLRSKSKPLFKNLPLKSTPTPTPTPISQVKMKFLATFLLFTSIASAAPMRLERSNQVNQINKDVPYFCDAHPDAYPCSSACKLSGALQEYCHPEFCDNPDNAKHWSCGPKYVNDHTDVLTECQKEWQRYRKDLEWAEEHKPYNGGQEAPPKCNETTNAIANGATTVVV
jgi:hypothetical protein